MPKASSSFSSDNLLYKDNEETESFPGNLDFLLEKLHVCVVFIGQGFANLQVTVSTKTKISNVVHSTEPMFLVQAFIFETEKQDMIS